VEQFGNLMLVASKLPLEPRWRRLQTKHMPMVKHESITVSVRHGNQGLGRKASKHIQRRQVMKANGASTFVSGVRRILPASQGGTVKSMFFASMRLSGAFLLHPGWATSRPGQNPRNKSFVTQAARVIGQRPLATREPTDPLRLRPT
jgi:hypothetical protein